MRPARRITPLRDGFHREAPRRARSARSSTLRGILVLIVLGIVRLMPQRVELPVAGGERGFEESYRRLYLRGLVSIMAAARSMAEPSPPVRHDCLEGEMPGKQEIALLIEIERLLYHLVDPWPPEIHQAAGPRSRTSWAHRCAAISQ